MYELLESIKRLGRDIHDIISGKNVELAIKDELNKRRALTGKIELEPIMVLNALRTSNLINAYAISDEELNEIIQLAEKLKKDKLISWLHIYPQRARSNNSVLLFAMQSYGKFLKFHLLLQMIWCLFIKIQLNDIQNMKMYKTLMI